MDVELAGPGVEYYSADPDSIEFSGVDVELAGPGDEYYPADPDSIVPGVDVELQFLGEFPAVYYVNILLN